MESFRESSGTTYLHIFPNKSEAHVFELDMIRGCASNTDLIHNTSLRRTISSVVFNLFGVKIRSVKGLQRFLNKKLNIESKEDGHIDRNTLANVFRVLYNEGERGKNALAKLRKHVYPTLQNETVVNYFKTKFNLSSNVFNYVRKDLISLGFTDYENIPLTANGNTTFNVRFISALLNYFDDINSSIVPVKSEHIIHLSKNDVVTLLPVYKKYPNIRKLIDLPYLLGGSSMKNGLDCSAIPSKLFNLQHGHGPYSVLIYAHTKTPVTPETLRSGPYPLTISIVYQHIANRKIPRGHGHVIVVLGKLIKNGQTYYYVLQAGRVRHLGVLHKVSLAIVPESILLKKYPDGHVLKPNEYVTLYKSWVKEMEKVAMR